MSFVILTLSLQMQNIKYLTTQFLNNNLSKKGKVKRSNNQENANAYN